MKHILTFLMMLSLSFGLFAQVLTCYDVQYTDDLSGDSPYMDQIVTVTGIVTGIVPAQGFSSAIPMAALGADSTYMAETPHLRRMWAMKSTSPARSSILGTHGDEFAHVDRSSLFRQSVPRQ